jgi:hypothetical protein
MSPLLTHRAAFEVRSGSLHLPAKGSGYGDLFARRCKAVDLTPRTPVAIARMADRDSPKA